RIVEPLVLAIPALLIPLSSSARPCRLRFQSPLPYLSSTDRALDPSRKRLLPSVLRAAWWAGRSCLRGSGAHDKFDLPARPGESVPVSPSTVSTRSLDLRWSRHIRSCWHRRV